MGTVGIIVNPHAGKDIRRLVTPATHTSDVTKVGIVRRAIIAAAESGATRILLAPDKHRLSERAAEGLDAPIEVVDEEISGSRFDTIACARRFWKEQVQALITLGGDGTSRDVATGWPDAPLIPISTGTNNVYPSAVDGTSAGAAAALVARGAVSLVDVGRRSKRIVVDIVDGESSRDDVALVEVAFTTSTFVGARAVTDPDTISAVVAAVATPASTGLSSIAGRVHPVDRWSPGGVFIRLAEGGRRVRVPLGPGSFTTLDVAEVRPLVDGEVVTMSGRFILAFDGERDQPVSQHATVSTRIESSGPIVIDVDRTLIAAAAGRQFDVDREPHESRLPHGKDSDGY